MGQRASKSSGAKPIETPLAEHVSRVSPSAAKKNSRPSSRLAQSLGDQLGPELLTQLEALVHNVRGHEQDASGPLTSERRLATIEQLFTTLKNKDLTTAAHSLRTTLGCSLWSERLKLSHDERESLETAALLHDVGKIIAPNDLLAKPAPLTPTEHNLLDLCRRVGEEVVADKLRLPEVVDIISHSKTWYDGSRGGNDARGLRLPFGARMLSIIDAFDAMTTDRPYRRAMSYQRALRELQRFAGRQFDPQLVEHLCRLPESEFKTWQALARDRCLPLLQPAGSSVAVMLPDFEPWGQDYPRDMYCDGLIENLRDGVVFVDRNLRILLWSPGMSNLTGVPASAVAAQRWTPALVGMRDGRGARIAEADCPVRYACQSGKGWLRRVLVTRPDGKHEAVDAQVDPIVSAGRQVLGVVIVMRDLSPEITLRERCVSLQQLITRDPLTQVANRAEFDRGLAHACTAFHERAEPFALILCDIDHFKQINDNYGHQAGDEVLKGFVKLLEGACRQEDLVARYGGEEFAIVCPGCSLKAAAQRAETIRRVVAQAPQPALGGRCVTASFGAAAAEGDDTPATIVRRCDAALYQAKGSGRNCVVARSDSAPQSDADATRSAAGQSPLVEEELLTMVPLAVAVEKLRGFIVDHDAEIIIAEDARLRVQVNSGQFKLSRRLSDRRMNWFIDVRLEDLSRDNHVTARGFSKAVSQTRLRVSVSAVRERDRRRQNVVEMARHLLAAFRSYMMVGVGEATPAIVVGQAPQEASR